MKIVPISFIAVLVTVLAQADTTIIGQAGPGVPIYEAQVPFDQFAQANEPQQQTEWCWAASISDIFRFYGHPISQQDVVQKVYHRIINLPAFSERMIASLVNRDWVDDNNQRFHARLTGVFDARAGVGKLNNPQLIKNLQDGHPLLFCNTQHCMVITEAKFTPYKILSLGVFDPSPLGPEAHPLSPGEMIPWPQGQLTFVAAISVTDVDSSDSNNSSNSSSSSDSSTSSDTRDSSDHSENNNAADVTGDWQGILRVPGGQLPLVLHIQGDGDDLSATLDSPAQRSFGIPVDSISFKHQRLTFSVDSLTIEFRGRLNDSIIRGTFEQRGQSFPLTLSKD